MSAAPAQPDALEIALDSELIGVSYMSALLRVFQATLRTVARTSDSTRNAFSQQPQPMLVMSSASRDGELRMRLRFADPLNGEPMAKLSSDVFEAFMEQFQTFLKALPQPGLWGASASGRQSRRYQSETEGRMEQLRLGILRFPRMRLSFDGSAVTLEDGHLEIG